MQMEIKRKPGKQQTHRSTEPKREPRNKPTHTHGQLIYDKGENTVSSISGIGKTGQLHIKE